MKQLYYAKEYDGGDDSEIITPHSRS